VRPVGLDGDVRTLGDKPAGLDEEDELLEELGQECGRVPRLQREHERERLLGIRAFGHQLGERAEGVFEDAGERG